MIYLAAVGAGLLTSTAFKPFAYWTLAILGLGIWYQILIISRFQKRFISSYLFGLAMLLPIQAWTATYVGNTPWLILCFGQAFIFTLPSFFVIKKGRYNSICFASAVVCTELLLRTIPFSGFGWSRVGFTQIDSPLSSLYPIGGVALVTLTIALLSTIRSFTAFAFPVLIILISQFITSPIQYSGSTRIALVQGGVSKLGLDFNSTPEEVFNRHMEQTIKTISSGSVDLVIWPENSVDVDLNTNSKVMDQLVNLSTNNKTPILVGAVTQSMMGPMNQSILFNPVKSDVYSKRYLTPFGEYLPLRKLSERVSKFAKNLKDFTAGENDQIINIATGQFQVLICYELINDSFINNIASEFLVIQTNNATFGDTAQLDQQFNIARVRALESGRYIPYVSTTGRTGFINPSGNVIAQIDKFKTTTLIDSVQKAEGLTYAQRFGKFVEPVAILLLILILIARKRLKS